MTAAGEPRILVDLSLAPLGGAATYVAGFVEGLTSGAIPEKQGIVALLSSQWAACNAPAVRALGGSGVVVDAIDTPAPGSWRARLGRGRLLRQAIRRHGAQVAFVPRDAVPTLPIPFVMLSRNLYAWQAFSSSAAVGGPLSAYLLRSVTRRSAARAAAVLTVSRAMIEAMDPGVKVTAVVHHGSSLEAFPRSACDEAGAPVAVMIANVIANKGIETVIDAVALARAGGRPWELRVHGNRSDRDYAERLERHAGTALGGSVLKGPAFGAALAEAYRSAHVLVVGGSFETFCFPLVEGMRSGCAVVAPECALVREICGEAAVTYAEGNPESLARALDAAWSDRNERSRLGVERSLAFTWARTAARTVELVREAGRARASQPPAP